MGCLAHFTEGVDVVPRPPGVHLTPRYGSPLMGFGDGRGGGVPQVGDLARDPT